MRLILKIIFNIIILYKKNFKYIYVYIYILEAEELWDIKVFKKEFEDKNDAKQYFVPFFSLMCDPLDFLYQNQWNVC